MLWVFIRNGQQLRCEVAHGDTPGHYRIVVRRPDRTEAVEDIVEPLALVERTVAVMRALHDDGWQIAP